MSLTNAMLVGFTGVNSNTVAIDTVGNNLANLNTTAFKGQRTLFENLLYQTIDEGSAPTAETGGSLPRQIGMGSNVASLQRNFAQGSLEGTGFDSDLALDGDGFFVLEAPDGSNVYTRDGSFRLDATQTLVSSNGSPLQVFPGDGSGGVDTGSLSNLIVPLGSTGDPRATTQVVMDGRFDSSTEIASGAAIVTSDPLITAAGSPATGATNLTELVNEFGVPLFADGDELTIGGSKGGINVAESAFTVGTTGSTVGDLAAHLETALGINVDPSTGNEAGVTVSDGTDAPAGSLVITSNLGETNAVALDGGSIVNRTSAVTSPIAFATTTPALGGGSDTTTSFNVFDSLGNPVDVRLRVALESKSEAGTVWRFYAESNGDSDLSPILGTGTITFDTNGRFVSATGTDLSVDLDGAGSATPMSFMLDFSRLTGLASADGRSEVSMASQDGAPAGIMTGFSIAEDGVVTAVYSNQDEVVLGQVALATFPNNEGLVALSDNTYAIGPNSGDVTIGTAQSGRAGTIRSGFLEQANVEIAREFINLITASMGVSAASRVIRASDDLLQELLLLAR